ncbi:MAG: permease-like cell division protein FtsX [Halioglobus sp.]
MAKPPTGTQRRDGASQSKARWRDHYHAWLRHHRLSAADSLVRILDNLGSSVMTWLVIGIALALPVALDVALYNTSSLTERLDSPAQISLFLRDNLSLQKAQLFQDELEELPDIDSLLLISSEEALAEFRILSGFADVLDSLQENPLPHLLLVTPTAQSEAAQVELLRVQLESYPEVAEAVLDRAWLQRLNSIMDLSRRLVLALASVLLLGVVLILGNTIRLAIENRRDEILIVKLVGGSNAFVRRPFLYTGLWYGVGGGLIAALLVIAALWFVDAPIQRLALSYQSSFTLQGLGIMGSLNLIMLGGLLGLAGAWLAVSRHLGAIEPR